MHSRRAHVLSQQMPTLYPVDFWHVRALIHAHMSVSIRRRQLSIKTWWTVSGKQEHKKQTNQKIDKDVFL